MVGIDHQGGPAGGDPDQVIADAKDVAGGGVAFEDFVAALVEEARTRRLTQSRFGG